MTSQHKNLIKNCHRKSNPHYTEPKNLKALKVFPIPVKFAKFKWFEFHVKF